MARKGLVIGKIACHLHLAAQAYAWRQLETADELKLESKRINRLCNGAVYALEIEQVFGNLLLLVENENATRRMQFAAQRDLLDLLEKAISSPHFVRKRQVCIYDNCIYLLCLEKFETVVRARTFKHLELIPHRFDGALEHLTHKCVLLEHQK